ISHHVRQQPQHRADSDQKGNHAAAPAVSLDENASPFVVASGAIDQANDQDQDGELYVHGQLQHVSENHFGAASFGPASLEAGSFEAGSWLDGLGLSSGIFKPYAGPANAS